MRAIFGPLIYKTMKISGITYPDVNNGTGFRVTLWVSGCLHHCNECQNPETWDFNYGVDFDDEKKRELFNILSKPYIKGLTLSGGDPICSYDDVLKLVKEVKNTYPNKDIWLFTGYTKEYMDKNNKEIMPYLDFIVDGPFIKELKDTSLAFRGSKNQNIWKNTRGIFQLIDDNYFLEN